MDQIILQQMSSVFSVWHTSRALGLTSYLLLFLAVLSGILQSLGIIPPKMRPILSVFHTLGGWLGMLLGLAHGLVLRFDDYINYSFMDIFVPFASHHEPLATSAGIVTLYIMFLLMITSDLMKKVGKALWRQIHYLAYASFFLASYHGLALGTDTQMENIRLLYIAALAILLFATLLRILSSQVKMQHAKKGLETRTTR